MWRIAIFPGPTLADVWPQIERVVGENPERVINCVPEKNPEMPGSTPLDELIAPAGSPLPAPSIRLYDWFTGLSVEERPAIFVFGLDLFRTPTRYYWTPIHRSAGIRESRTIPSERIHSTDYYRSEKLDLEARRLSTVSRHYDEETTYGGSIRVVGSPHSLAPFEGITVAEFLAAIRKPEKPDGAAEKTDQRGLRERGRAKATSSPELDLRLPAVSEVPDGMDPGRDPRSDAEHG